MLGGLRARSQDPRPHKIGHKCSRDQDRSLKDYIPGAGDTPAEHRRGAHLLSQAFNLIGVYTTESVMHGQRNARLMVTFSASVTHYTAW